MVLKINLFVFAFVYVYHIGNFKIHIFNKGRCDKKVTLRTSYIGTEVCKYENLTRVCNSEFFLRRRS